MIPKGNYRLPTEPVSGFSVKPDSNDQTPKDAGKRKPMLSPSAKFLTISLSLVFITVWVFLPISRMLPPNHAFYISVILTSIITGMTGAIGTAVSIICWNDLNKRD